MVHSKEITPANTCQSVVCFDSAVFLGFEMDHYFADARLKSR